MVPCSGQLRFPIELYPSVYSLPFPEYCRSIVQITDQQRNEFSKRTALFRTELLKYRLQILVHLLPVEHHPRQVVGDDVVEHRADDDRQRLHLRGVREPLRLDPVVVPLGVRVQLPVAAVPGPEMSPGVGFQRLDSPGVLPTLEAVRLVDQLELVQHLEVREPMVPGNGRSRLVVRTDGAFQELPCLCVLGAEGKVALDQPVGSRELAALSN